MGDKINMDSESLMLDAKKAILEDQHRRFQELQAAGMWEDAMKQLHVTLGCAADLLQDSVALLEKAAERNRFPKPPAPPIRPLPEKDGPPSTG